MTMLTILSTNQELEVQAGSSLLDALLQMQPQMLHKCGGNAKCGSCHIFVHEGRKGISKPTREENEMLDTIIGVSSKSRLACQSKILGTDNIKVELLSFGSGL